MGQIPQPLGGTLRAGAAYGCAVVIPRDGCAAGGTVRRKSEKTLALLFCDLQDFRYDLSRFLNENGVPDVYAKDGAAVSISLDRRLTVRQNINEYYKKYGVRKYGFHGTSHSYVSKRTAEILGKPLESLKMI